jgi:hypothetical protein
MILGSEWCQNCGRPSGTGFRVPDGVWAAALPPALHDTTLCIVCFADFADHRLVEWDQDIEFFPVSLRYTARLQGAEIVRAPTVTGAGE